MHLPSFQFRSQFLHNFWSISFTTRFDTFTVPVTMEKSGLPFEWDSFVRRGMCVRVGEIGFTFRFY